MSVPLFPAPEPPAPEPRKPIRYADGMGAHSRAADDWYMDPPEATEALLAVERFSGTSWDPACGVGTIPKVMQAAGHKCLGTDLVDRGYGSGVATRWDFLIGGAESGVANIVSNPPYNLAQAFAERALSIASHKVAFLLPLTFLEGERRARWRVTTPLARIRTFSWRLSMPPGHLLTTGRVEARGGKKAFAWFIWEHGWTGPAQEIPLLRTKL